MTPEKNWEVFYYLKDLFRCKGIAIILHKLGAESHKIHY